MACYDAVEITVPPPPKEPISTVSNCADALPALQSSLIADGNMTTFIAIGTDEGLSGEGNADGSYQLAICSAADQEQCVDQCPTPTSETYTCGTLPLGGKCLTDRRCATSDELPTGNPNAPNYCWELSHQVDVGNGTFIPPTELESGSATWEQYAGSICTKVTTTFAGRQYSYWTPAGCPK